MKNIIIILALFTFVQSQSIAQINLPVLDSLKNYFEGSWELKEHYYSIAGILDTFPNSENSYHFIFAKTQEDSVLNCKGYHNGILVEETNIIVVEQFNSSMCNWALTDFPNVLEDWPYWQNFYVCLFNVSDNEIYLGDLIPDGSTIKLARSNFSSIEEIQPAYIDLTFYPNPAMSDQVSISKIDGLKNADVSIYNLAGQLLRTINQHDLENKINLKDLPSGQLIFELSSRDKSYVGSVLKI